MFLVLVINLMEVLHLNLILSHMKTLVTLTQDLHFPNVQTERQLQPR